MHFTQLDAYYHLATHGDLEAFNVLYKEFLSIAKIIAKSCIDSSSNFSGNPDDFYVLIDKMFFRTLSEYDSSKGAFSKYVEYVITKRLTAIITSNLIDSINQFVQKLDYLNELDFIDNLYDPNQIPIQSDVTITSFKQKIASPNRNKTAYQRVRDKIILLQMAGYTNMEICTKLKLTYNQLRTYLKNMQKDADIRKLKLELK